MFANIKNAMALLMLLIPAAGNAQNAGLEERVARYKQKPTGGKMLSEEELEKYTKDVRILLNKTAVNRIEANLDEINLKRMEKNLLPLTDADLGRLYMEAEQVEQDIIVESDVSEDMWVRGAGAFMASSTTPPWEEDIPLPHVVDNTEGEEGKHFPEIGDQVDLGSCVSWATTYYQYSYEVARLYDWHNQDGINDDDTTFSPAWTYNINNGGGNGGSSSSDAFTLLSLHGAALWKDFPYDGDLSTEGDETPTLPEDIIKFTRWPTDAQTWRDALNFRAEQFGYIGLYDDTARGIETIKGVLFSGHVLSFGTDFYAWQYSSILNGVNTGQECATHLDTADGFGSHHMTIVGFNDDIWCDVNGNRTRDPGEIGAFKIANSHGTQYSNNGFTWLAYDALYEQSNVTVSGVTDPNPVGREMALREVAWILPKQDYQPTLIGELTVTVEKRKAMYMTYGISTTVNDTEPEVEWEFPAWSGNGGDRALDGSDTTVAATFSFDLTGIIQNDSSLEYFVGFENGNGWAEDPKDAILSGLTIVDGHGNLVFNDSSNRIVPSGDLAYYSFGYPSNDPSLFGRIGLSDDEIEFNVIVDQNHAQSINITNTGVGMLTITRIDSCPQFKAGEYVELPLYIPAGVSESIGIVYNPPTSSEDACTVTIHSTSPETPTAEVTVVGTAVAENVDGDLKLYASVDSDPEDDSILVNVDLHNDGYQAVDLSNYKVLYYLYNPDISTGDIDLFVDGASGSTIQPSGQLKPLVDTFEWGSKTADSRIEINFPSNSILYGGTSVSFSISLTMSDESKTFSEQDDWSHYIASDALAENMVILDHNTMTAVFGKAPVATFYDTEMTYDYDSGNLVYHKEDNSLESWCCLNIYGINSDYINFICPLELIDGVNEYELPDDVKSSDGSYTAKLQINGKTIASTDFVIGGMLGDVNGDLSITIVDALLIAQFYVGLDPEPPFFNRYADVDGDGSITIIDALLVAQYYVGLIDTFPAEN